MLVYNIVYRLVILFMFSDPTKVVERFGLTPGMHVADFGAGSGFYTFAISKIVSDTGKVYSIDIQKDLLVKIKSEARKLHVFNVEVLWGDLEKAGGSKLNNNSVDAAVVANILFQIKDKKVFIDELKRILKPNGKVLVVDWKESFGGIGPHPSDVFSIKEGREFFEKEGFAFERELSDAGEHHYALIFKKI
jgi:ubiquinone/menaquinone biosynthesis C-methylase UbiE